MESVRVTDACQRFEYEIAELVGIGHIGLTLCLVHKSADEFLFVGARYLQKPLVLRQKLA
jgi:hypothetical protein